MLTRRDDEANPTDVVSTGASGAARVTVEGVGIAFEEWPGTGDRGVDLLLVHGARGQREWWHTTVAHLRSAAGARFGTIAAVDLSGHGASDHRAIYDWRDWAAEVAAVAQRYERPVLVGHSIGGLVTLATAVLHPSVTRAVICVDSRLRGDLAPPLAAGDVRRRVYSTVDEAVAGFRLTPAQPVRDTAALRRLATAALREVPGGWTWRSDPAVQGAFWGVDRDDLVRRLTLPFGLVTAGHSVVAGPRQADDVRTELAPGLEHEEIPDAHHHVMIDHAAELAAAIQRLNTRLAVRESHA